MVDLLPNKKSLAPEGPAITVRTLHTVLHVRLEHARHAYNKLPRVDRHYVEQEHAADLLHVCASAILHLCRKALHDFGRAHVLEDSNHCRSPCLR